MKAKGQFFSIRNPNTGDYSKSRYAKHNFGQTVSVSRGGRNWRAVIKEALLDRDMNFLCWKVRIVNWRLWYRKFPSNKCTHWRSFNDSNFI